jgi:hypothetical protein
MRVTRVDSHLTYLLIVFNQLDPRFDLNRITLNTNPLILCRIRVGFAGHVKHYRPY